MYRRKNFYQRRGYKLAISRFRANGSLTRTYKFYCNPYLLYNDSFSPVEFAWGSEAAPQIITGTYAPISYSTISFSNLVRLKNYATETQAKQFTGPCNMYGVYDLPVEYARVLGYREYTVINLSQVGFSSLEVAVT